MLKRIALFGCGPFVAVRMPGRRVTLIRKDQ